MTPTLHRLSLIVFFLLESACAAPLISYQLDVTEIILLVESDQVTSVTLQILREDGYQIEAQPMGGVITGYRKEINSPWDGLLNWGFGTGRSRIEAQITPLSEFSTKLELRMLYEAKDGLFSKWEGSPTPLPQSTQNQLRLIKSALHIL